MVFSGNLMTYFRKPDGYANDVKISAVTVRGEPTDILVTPHVRAWAADHYGCDRLLDDTETDDVFKGM